MLQHLTNYLLQYKKVTVPKVGTLQLIIQPPQLDVANQQLQPPSYILEIRPEENVSDHQLNYLRLVSKDSDAVATKLQFFGGSLQQEIADGGFDWDGLGRFTPGTKQLVLGVAAFEALPAQKVIRKDVGHNVLVGDKEMSSAQLFEHQASGSTATKRNTAVWIGWVLLVILLLLVLLVLYTGKFRTTAAGTRLAPTSWIFPDF